MAIPYSKVRGASMGPIWGRQDPIGPHVGPMNFATWDARAMCYFCGYKTVTLIIYSKTLVEQIIHPYGSHTLPIEIFFFTPGTSREGIIVLPGLILGLRPANERQCYFVTTSFIGWTQA